MSERGLRLYLNLYNRLELDNATLMEEMEKREHKPELQIWNTGFFAEVERGIVAVHKGAAFLFLTDSGKTPTIMSRRGSGDYLEKNIFHSWGIRFIAVNDRFDSAGEYFSTERTDHGI